MVTPKTLQNILFEQTCEKQFVIAYSGGLDSHVLLDALAQLRDQTQSFSITAVHVNHHLNIKATDWARHCQQVCDALNVPLHIETIQIDRQPGESLEAVARTLRYQALAKYIDKNRVLLTAHHLDDQAETFLLQALRGSGLSGLSAMPIKKSFVDSFHVRPLLTFSRLQLAEYADKNALKWVDDDSNIDSRFNRNFIRHEIIPLLQSRFPATVNNFSRSTTLISEADQLLHAALDEDFQLLLTDDKAKLNLKKLLEFSHDKQRYLLRVWLRENLVLMPSEKQLKQIQQDVLHAKSDANPIFQLGEWCIRRYRSEIFLLNSNVVQSKECFRKKPGQSSKSYKKQCQSQGIPPWER